MKKFLEILKKCKDVILLVIITVLFAVMLGQCGRANQLNDKIARMENNEKALTEQIVNYKDELGRSNAEKHAYQLTQEELRDSIGLLKEKNKEYLTYLNSQINITDTVTVETVIVKEVDAEVEGGSINIDKSDVFGNSSRSFSVNIPYSVNENKLFTGDATFTLNQDIFVEGWLERNTKTNETFIHLRSDYPGLVFNSGMGIVADSGKAYERSLRKTWGFGLAVGPNVGLSYDFFNQKFIPTVGFGLTIGLTYTPKLLQW
jgi:gas vesicle protein